MDMIVDNRKQETTNTPQTPPPLGTNLSNQERYVLQLLVDLDKMTGIAKENKRVAMELAEQRDSSRSEVDSIRREAAKMKDQIDMWEPSIVACGKIKAQLQMIIGKYSSGAISPEDTVETIATLYRECFATSEQQTESDLERF